MPKRNMSLEEMLFRGPPPPPQHLASVALPFVKQAKPRYKVFREDLERIQGDAVDAAKAGGIDMEDAKLIWLDVGEVVSLPLMERYFDKGEYELVARFLKHKMTYTPHAAWLTPRNRQAIDGLIGGGEAALAVGLLRHYLHHLHKHAQQVWRTAGRKRPANLRPVDEPIFDEYREEAIAKLPGILRITELEMAEIEPYISAHGSREDNRALEKLREEIAKVRKRFDLV